MSRVRGPLRERQAGFISDGPKGNTGPTGYADIKDGEYDASAEGGQGIVGGPTIVAIEGIDPPAKPDKADPSGEVTAKALFPRYEAAADLPKSDGTKDFDVPADAVKGTAPQGPAVIIP